MPIIKRDYATNKEVRGTFSQVTTNLDEAIATLKELIGAGEDANWNSADHAEAVELYAALSKFTNTFLGNVAGLTNSSSATDGTFHNFEMTKAARMRNNVLSNI